MISSDARIGSILGEGHALLACGRAHDASLAFERVLLQNPDHPEARAALAQARTAMAEEIRTLDVQLREAQRLIDNGDPEQARPLLEEVVRRGGDRDAARELLDRPVSPGVAVFALPGATSLPVFARPPRRRRRVHSRLLLSAAWAALLLAVACGLISRWDAILSGLTATPAPGALAVAVASYTVPSPGERAVAEARTQLDTGNAEAALTTLARVGPDDPAFPFATQLRAQAARAKQGTR